MIFTGYLGYSTDGETYNEVLNACRTLSYIGQRTFEDEHGPEYTYPHPFWRPDRSACATACCDFFPASAEYTYPADPTNPAPWYDADVDASEEFFGMLIDEFTVTQGYGPGQNRSTTRGRQARRQKRVGTIRGFLVANSCAGTTYGLEWLAATLAQPANTGGDCRSGACGANIEVWRTGADPAGVGRASGQRFLHGASGFVVTELPDDPEAIACPRGAWIEITFEVENTRAWLPAENIATIATNVTAAVCEDNFFDDSCETTPTDVTRNRVSRPVRVQKNGKLCPIGWELNDWNGDTDRLVIGEVEQVDAQADAAGYLLSLRQDPVTLTIDVYDVITGDLFDDTEWECGTPVEIVELQYANPDYQPLCLDCPGAYEDCADAESIDLDAGGYIDWVSTGIDTDVWYLYDPDAVGAGTDPELTQLAAYWDCINLQATGPSNSRLDAPSVGQLDLLLQSAKDAFVEEFVIPHGVDPLTGPDVLRVRVGINSGGIGPTYINAQSGDGTGPGYSAINVSYRLEISEWPGWNRSIYEDDAICGEATTIPDHCKPVLTERLNPNKPLAAAVAFETVDTGPF